MQKRTSVFVVEGPDGSGKSTFVGGNAFMGEQKDHCGPPKTLDPFSEYMALIKSRCEGPTQRNVAVFDRLHLGELVYGPIFRGESRLSLEQSLEIDDWLLRNTLPVLVLCLPPLEVVKRNVNLTDGSQLPRTTLQLEQIYGFYERAHEVTRLPIVRHDYTRSPEEWARTFKACVGLQEARWDLIQSGRGH